MTPLRALIAAAVGLFVVGYSLTSGASVANAETAVRSGPTATTCYVFGYSPADSIDVVVSLGDC